jgi:uncharacterized FlaG/YvyC family protein
MEVSSISSTAAAAVTATKQTPVVSKDEAAQRRDLIKAAGVINANQAVGSNNELVFVLDRVSHRAIMQVVDRETKKVVMQLPPEYVLHLAQSYY